jgi:hypothetical protein
LCWLPASTRCSRCDISPTTRAVSLLSRLARTGGKGWRPVNLRVGIHSAHESVCHRGRSQAPPWSPRGWDRWVEQVES